MAMYQQGPAAEARGRAVEMVSAEVGRMADRWRATVGTYTVSTGVAVVSRELAAVVSAWRRAVGARPDHPVPAPDPGFTDVPEPDLPPSPREVRAEVAQVAQACTNLARQALMVPQLGGAVAWPESQQRRWWGLASALFSAAVRAYQEMVILDDAHTQDTPVPQPQPETTPTVPGPPAGPVPAIPGWSLTMRGVRGGR